MPAVSTARDEASPALWLCPRGRLPEVSDATGDAKPDGRLDPVLGGPEVRKPGPATLDDRGGLTGADAMLVGPVASRAQILSFPNADAGDGGPSDCGGPSVGGDVFDDPEPLATPASVPSAKAMPGQQATTAPIPRAAANAPIRPMYAAQLVINRPSPAHDHAHIPQTSTYDACVNYVFVADTDDPKVTT